MNLFSKGKGLMGALRVNGVIANNTQTTKTTVTTLTDAPETLTAAMVVTNGGLLAGTPLHHEQKLFRQELLLVRLWLDTKLVTLLKLMSSTLPHLHILLSLRQVRVQPLLV
jgi:hypothetical protein